MTGSTDPAAELAAFEASHSRTGLAERYARGRIRGFAGRQVLTLGGALTLAFLTSPFWGVATAAAALFGEVLDCAVLGWLLRSGMFHVRPGRAFLLSTLSGGLQGLTIAFCVLVAWLAMPDQEGRFFAVAFLAGAAVNAGLALPFHRPAALVRLAIYAIAPVPGFMAALGGEEGLSEHVAFDILGVGLFGYMVAVMLGFAIRSTATNRAQRRALLEEKVRLIEAGLALAEKQEEASRLAMVAKVANDSVIITAPDRRIIWVNETFTRLTGYTPEEVIGRDPASVLNGPNTSAETNRIIDEAARAGRPCRVEIENLRKDGTPIWMEANLTPVFDETGRHVMTISVERDITEQRRRAEELEAARAAAEAAARAKAEFLATMSHEIRTPLNGIIGMADMLADGRLSRAQRECVRSILDSGTALLTIINDILDFSKLEAGHLEVSPAPFDPAELLRDCVQLLAHSAREKGIALDGPVGDLPPRIMGDAGRVRQIVVNLLGNAVKFTEEGGVTLTCGQAGGRWFVEVTDTGIGIPPDRLDAVFDRFTQADGAITRRFGGTGLGLAISRQLARLMGGDITVQSEPGVGSTFRLELPCEEVRSTGDAAPDPPPGGADEARPPPGLRVLVAEDNRTNRLLMKKMLGALGAEVAFAEDGVEAVEMAARLAPEVILMDMSMPRLDGLEATRRIRAAEAARHAAPVTIIALTANAFAEDRERCLAAGMTDFLTKPIRRPVLAAALARAARQAAEPGAACQADTGKQADAANAAGAAGGKDAGGPADPGQLADPAQPPVPPADGGNTRPGPGRAAGPRRGDAAQAPRRRRGGSAA